MSGILLLMIVFFCNYSLELILLQIFNAVSAFFSRNALVHILSSLKDLIIFNKLLQYWGIEAEWSTAFRFSGIWLGPHLMHF